MRKAKRIFTCGLIGVVLIVSAVFVLPFIMSRNTALVEVVASPGSAIELRVLELTNAERARYMLSPLQWCTHLGAAAREHSVDMAIHNRLDHDGTDGSSPWDRIVRIGVSFSGTMAENVAAGQQTAEDVVASWMNSEGHRANILSPNLTYLGVGHALSGSTPFWTQKFAGGTRIHFIHSNYCLRSCSCGNCGVMCHTQEATAKNTCVQAFHATEKAIG